MHFSAVVISINTSPASCSVLLCRQHTLPTPCHLLVRMLHRSQALANQVKAAKTQTRQKQAAVKKLDTQLQRVKADMKATLEVGTGFWHRRADWIDTFVCCLSHSVDGLL